MAKQRTQKETIEFDGEFLAEWNTFCDAKGYVKRQAAHAARRAFMGLTPQQREQFMAESMTDVAGSRTRRGKR